MSRDRRTPEAQKWADDYLPPETCGSIDTVQNDLEHLRDANSQLRHVAHAERHARKAAEAEATRLRAELGAAREGLGRIANIQVGWYKPHLPTTARQMVDDCEAMARAYLALLQSSENDGSARSEASGSVHAPGVAINFMDSIDACQFARNWVDGIALADEGPHRRIETLSFTESDGGAIVYFCEERVKAAAMIVRDTWNYSVALKMFEGLTPPVSGAADLSPKRDHSLSVGEVES